MIQFVKTAQNNLNTNGPVILSYSISPGDFVVVAVSFYFPTTTIASLIDNGGNTYNLALTFNSSATTPAIFFYTTTATSPATTITLSVTVTQSGNIQLLAITLSGVTGVGSNTASQAITTATTNLTLTSTIATASNWMTAIFSSRTNPGAFTLVTGNLRYSATTAATIRASMDNTGALSVTCAGTVVTAVTYSAASIELVAALPVLNSISPISGMPGNTVPITISGTHLTGATTINLSGSGITVNSLVVVNDTTLTANFVIASGAPLGIQAVSVVTPVGTSNTVNFNVTTLPAPVLSSMSPNTAAVVNPTFTVTFHGTNLTGTTAVNVGGASITVSNITVISDTVVTANFTISQTAHTGTFNISLTTPNGISNTLPFTLTLRPAGQAIFYDRIASMWAFRTRRR